MTQCLAIASPDAHDHHPWPAGVAEELLWFVKGCTNANLLKEKVGGQAGARCRVGLGRG